MGWSWRGVSVIAVALLLATPVASARGAPPEGSGPPEARGRGVVHGEVWHDLNVNGLRDAGEPAVDTEVDILVEGRHVLGLRTLTRGGRYRFVLPPGEYQLRFTRPPGGWAFTRQDVGGADDRDSDVDAFGDTGTFVVAGGAPPPAISAGVVTAATVTGAVWLDGNGNDLDDGPQNEARAESALVVLRDVDTGQTSMTVQPFFFGRETYVFATYPGRFFVEVWALEGTGFVARGAQPADAVDNDSDVDPATGRSDTFAIESGETVERDAGLRVGAAAPVGQAGESAVGDLVWVDRDEDGVQDDEEPGVAGVEVWLTTRDGRTVRTTSTDATGRYAFSGLRPGEYRVHTPEEVGKYTAPFRGGDSSRDSDASELGAPVFLPIDKTDTTIDLGYRPIVISGMVWDDRNGDGRNSNADEPRPGVEARLLDADGQPAGDPVVTGADGRYEFRLNRPGRYQVQIVAPPGTTFSHPRVGDVVPADTHVDAQGFSVLFDDDDELGYGDIRMADAGLIPAGGIPPGTGGDAQIIGVVWDDENGDGLLDGDEAGVAGIEVVLRSAAGTHPELGRTTTGQSGTYGFPGLNASTYVIQVIQPTERVFTRTAVNGGIGASGDSDVDAFSGFSPPITVATTAQADAGLALPAAIGDAVWFDADGDGLQATPGAPTGPEPTMGDILVELASEDGSVRRSQRTHLSTGLYRFAQLPPGSYTVRVKPPPDFAFTIPTAGDPTANSDVVEAVATDDGLRGVTAPVELDAGTTDVDVDAGLTWTGDGPPVLLGDGFVSVRVWEEHSGIADGRDSGPPLEPGTDGVTVRLLTPDGVPVEEGTTTGGGHHQFSVAPGTYVLEVEAPPGMLFTHQDAAGDDRDSDVDATGRVEVTVAARQDALVGAGVVPAAHIGNTVWLDFNGDGVQNETSFDSGVAGVTVQLQQFGLVVATTTTDDQGRYGFDALPGAYRLRFLPPPGFGFTVRRSDVDDVANSDALPSGFTAERSFRGGEPDLRVDAGLVRLDEPPATVPNTGVVHGWVWDDRLGDLQGVQEPAEDSAPFERLALVPTTGGPPVAQIDAGSGRFVFWNVPPGGYRLHVVPVEGRALTYQHRGIDGTRDSDIAPVTLLSDVLVVGGGTQLTVDAGMTLPSTIGDRVWRDTDGDGVQDLGEAGVAGIPVFLLDELGEELLDPGGDPRQTVTGSGGLYQFDDLGPGRYRIGFVTTEPFTQPLQGADSTKDSDAVPGDQAGSFDAVTPAIGVVIDDVRLDIDAGLLPLPAEPVSGQVDTRVRYDGPAGLVPVPGQPVLILDSATLSQVGECVTDETGSCSVQGLPDGSYIAFTNPPANTSGFSASVLSGKDADNDFDPFTGRTDAFLGGGPAWSKSLQGLLVDASSLSGTVETEAGTAVTGVEVRLNEAVTGAAMGIDHTDTAGLFGPFLGLPTGSYLVEISYDTDLFDLVSAPAQPMVVGEAEDVLAHFVLRPRDTGGGEPAQHVNNFTIFGNGFTCTGVHTHDVEAGTATVHQEVTCDGPVDYLAGSAHLFTSEGQLVGPICQAVTEDSSGVVCDGSLPVGDGWEIRHRTDFSDPRGIVSSEADNGDCSIFEPFATTGECVSFESG